MRQTTLQRLLELNREFYQSFAEPFSQTRGRLQPGVLRALQGLAPEAGVLDLGCGSGELAAELARRGHQGVYVGLDSGEAVLRLARRKSLPSGWRFIQADLAGADWAAQAQAAARRQQARAAAGQPTAERSAEDPGARPAGARSRLGDSTRFDRIFAFAVLHHIPGNALRIRLLRRAQALLAPGGRLTLSVWNFLASPRLRERIRPWREVGLADAELDPGDYLLDWRLGGRGLRYVHHFTEPELAALAQASGFEVFQGYLADGERGVLGRYQDWEIAGPS